MKFLFALLFVAVLAYAQASINADEEDLKDLAEKELTDFFDTGRTGIEREARGVIDKIKNKLKCKTLGQDCRGLIRCCGSNICNPATKTCLPCIPPGSRCTTIKRKCCSGSCHKKWYQFNGVCF